MTEHEADSVLDALYDECLTRMMRGETINLDEFCDRHPERTEEIRERLEPLLATAGPAQPETEEGGAGRLGEFRLIRELGSGGMGIVYLATQESLGRNVALKVIKPAFADSPISRARFQREAGAVARLSHPNIVTVHTAGEQSGRLYLAMDYVEGRGLDELIVGASVVGGTLPVNDSIRFAAQIARALACAHEAGIVHRDVKPSNVRVTPDGRAMLLDFGLARDRDTLKLTLTGEFQGSPFYVAPELIGSRSDGPDGRTDIYALGVTLYECLTGRVPFEGVSLEQVLHKIVTEPPPAPRKSNAALSRDIETVVLKALEKDPARRYQTAAAFADDLEAVLALRPIKAVPPGAVTRALAGARRRPWLTASVSSLAIMLVGYGGMKLYESRQRRATADGLVRNAERELDRGQFEDASNDIARALENDDEHAGALALLMRVESARRQAEATKFVDAARQSAGSHVEALARWRTLRGELAPLLAARNVHHITMEQSQKLDRGELDLARIESELELAETAATLAIEKARALGDDGDAGRTILADLYLARMLAALEAGEALRAERCREVVAANDPNGRLKSELSGEGRLSLVCEPAGAEIHLYEYRDQAKLSDKGERRLVPVPVKELKPAPRPFGAWVLVVVGDAPPLRAGDLVLGVAGRPVRNTVLVAKGAGDIERLDKLAAIDGRVIHDVFEARYAEQLAAPAPKDTHRYDFERPVPEGDPKKFTVEAASLAAIGVEVASPLEIAAAGGVGAEVWHDGAMSKMKLPEGLDLRATGAPLYVGPQTLFAVAPIAEESLPPGSYLALIRSEGFEDQRVPFVVGRKARLDLRVTLQPRGATPEGFRRIEPWGVCMMEREVTFREFLLFLNDVAQARSESEIESLLPRLPDDPRGGALVRRGDDGRFTVVERALDLPVHGVSFDTALAFARWRTESGAVDGGRWSFDLPRSGEWEHAARGADDRALVCGDHFVANWLSSRLARPRATIEPVFSFPVDESPYGVYDLGGSMNEWCRPDAPEAQGDAVVRGGAWDTPLAEAFRADWYSLMPSATRSATIGFRLVAREG